MKQPIIYQQKEWSMVKRALVSGAIVGFFFVVFFGICAAGDSPPEVISFKGSAGRPMEAPGVYPRLYSGAVLFNHEKHFSDYGPSCPDCHHDDSGAPRTDLTSGMDVDNCIDCHDDEVLVYGRPADELSDADLIAHRANVVHRLCVGCHERSSAKAAALVAPLACRGCHGQRERDYILR